MKHAGAVGKCDRASQQTVNSRAPRRFLFFPPELHIFPDSIGNDDGGLDLSIGQCLE
jgi:hypothetical protein